jgi:hypothetical protein
LLISEGPKTRTVRMLEEQRRSVNRVLPNVPVTTISVGPDTDSIPLHRIPRTLAKIKPVLTKAEVMAISNRLQSLENPMPIPKGVDPMKVRAQRSR